MDEFSRVLLQVSKLYEMRQVKPDCPLPYNVPPIGPTPTTWEVEGTTMLHNNTLQVSPGLDASTQASGQIFGTVALRVSQMPDVFNFIKRKRKVLIRFKSSNMYNRFKIPLRLLRVWLHSHSWGKNNLSWDWLHIFHYLFISIETVELAKKRYSELI